MPNTRSAEKRLRQNAKCRSRNRAAMSRLRSQVKALRAAVEAGDAATAKTELTKCESLLDRTARKGIIHKQTAARNKSRLCAQVSKLAAAGPAAQ